MLVFLPDRLDHPAADQHAGAARDRLQFRRRGRIAGQYEGFQIGGDLDLFNAELMAKPHARSGTEFVAGFTRTDLLFANHIDDPVG